MLITQEAHDYKLFSWQVAAFIAVMLGIYARLIGLNTWSLAVDEYFIIKSTDYILDKGVPQYPCGGYYLRGLIMQYIIAAERLLGVPSHLAVRLVSATSYFISLPAIFILSRRLSGNILAYACVILFSLSAWEIEFARFGRMYSLFQSVFLWYLIFLVRAIVDDYRPARKSMYILTIVALFLWEGAIFLAILNFLPASLNYKNIKWKDWVISGVLFLSVYIFLTTNFRFWDQLNPLPLDLPNELEDTEYSNTTSPDNGINGIIWPLIALIPLGISIWFVTNIAKTKPLHWLIKSYLFSIVVLSLAHLYGVIVYLSLIFFLYDPANFIKTIKLKWKLILAITLTSLILWSVYYLVSPDFIQSLPSDSKVTIIINLIKKLFGFPDIFTSFIFVWLPVMPAFFILFVFLFSIYIYFIIRNEEYKNNFDFRFILLITISLIYIVSLVDTPYNQTRYLFFIYPVLIISTAYFLKLVINHSWAKKFLNCSLAISIIVLMLISKDWNTNHVFNVDSYDINYRTVYSNKYNLTKHYYPRRDKADPAEYVNKNREEDDIVIISEVPFDYYLDRFDYVYRSYDHKEFGAVSCDQGKLERWSNASLIYKENDLYNIIENAKSYVWLILLERRINTDQINIRKKYNSSSVYRSPDNEYIIYKIPGGKLS